MLWCGQMLLFMSSGKGRYSPKELDVAFLWMKPSWSVWHCDVIKTSVRKNASLFILELPCEPGPSQYYLCKTVTGMNCVRQAVQSPALRGRQAGVLVAIPWMCFRR